MVRRGTCTEASQFRRTCTVLARSRAPTVKFSVKNWWCVCSGERCGVRERAAIGVRGARERSRRVCCLCLVGEVDGDPRECRVLKVDE